MTTSDQRAAALALLDEANKKWPVTEGTFIEGAFMSAHAHRVALKIVFEKQRFVTWDRNYMKVRFKWAGYGDGEEMFNLYSLIVS